MEDSANREGFKEFTLGFLDDVIGRQAISKMLIISLTFLGFLVDRNLTLKKMYSLIPNPALVMAVATFLIPTGITFSCVTFIEI